MTISNICIPHQHYQMMLGPGPAGQAGLDFGIIPTPHKPSDFVHGAVHPETGTALLVFDPNLINEAQQVSVFLNLTNDFILKPFASSWLRENTLTYFGLAGFYCPWSWHRASSHFPSVCFRRPPNSARVWAFDVISSFPVSAEPCLPAK